ncbi:TIGR02453 family protein [Aliiroseovarius sp. KMU-50]|uniref:TIGR02453 family protein n=1 Tax=Aliiroseovarius salicola TaxID=3009082 RepID=A0ABT4VYW1_9RHOB|nr:TIGR02453 family protein [Aliiroseovarius sp. KMU-50]MDA5093444.1 TIGR02453 family protein [Aliiroseovarius sp. KMU-50]
MFSQESVEFLRELAAHNEKPWFEANKPRYVTHVREAAAQFSDAICPILARRYGTSVTGKLFRIHRDLRFSKDKTPYNTHIHMSFTDGATGAAWMIGLEMDRLVIGYGLFAFDKARLDKWREVVAGSAGVRLHEVLNDAHVQGLSLDPPELKRVPAPYPSDHPNQELLRRKGIALWSGDLPQEKAFGEAAAHDLATAFEVFDPLRNWLVDNLPG